MSKQEILKNPWMDFASYGIKDASRFKGREEEIKKFSRILDSGTMSVLYANSGIGKTSFLNAGISPIYQKMGYFPIYIVFPDEVFKFRDMEAWLLMRVKDAFTKQDGSNAEKDRYTWESTINTEIEECKDSLWWHLHTQVMKDHKTGEAFFPLLVFDQFEEIFTKSKKYTNVEIIDNFFKLVGQLASTSLPYEIEKELDRQDDKGNYVEIDSEHHYKVVFSLRKEYLSDFDYWTNDVNSVSELHQNRMFLLPLKREQAEKVITQQPVGCDGKCYTTLNNVTKKILDLIDPKRKDEIEPYMLSALCSKLYNKAISENKTQLDPDDVDANINNIILEIYEEKVQSVFDDTNHLKRFEEVLVDGDGHRNRPKIKDLDDICFADRYQKKLEDAHLIRIDTYDDDIKYIELIHDLLAKAINKKRENDVQDNRIAELEKKQKKQKYIYVGIVVFLLAIVSGGLTWIVALQKKGDNELNSYHICLKANVIEDGGVKKGFGPDDYWDVNLFFSTTDGKKLELKKPIDSSLCNFHKGGGADSIQLTFTEAEIESLRTIKVEIRPKTTLCRKDSIFIDLKKMRGKSIPINITKNMEETDLFEGIVLTKTGNAMVPLNDVLIVVAGRITYTDTNGHYSISIPRGNTIFNHITAIKQGYNVGDDILKDSMNIILERNTSYGFAERQNEIRGLWKMAEKNSRKRNKEKTEIWEGRLLKKFHIDSLGQLKRGFGRNNQDDSLLYVYYNFAAIQNPSNAKDVKIGDVRNIVGTYQGVDEQYIFEGYMTLNQIGSDADQWMLEIVKYDTIFNTRKKEAILFHSTKEKKTKLVFTR